jgi:hypothetical protein
MIKGYKRYSVLASLFLFLLVSLFINFFHCEKTLTRNDNCPACQFLDSSLTTNQIDFFHLPPPSILGILKSLESLNHTFILSSSPTSRSPPNA